MEELADDATEAVAELGRARVLREGDDVTMVSAMRGVHDCLAAAELLAPAGIEAEVIDLRTIRPLDRATVLTSLAKTNRLVVVEEGPRTGGWAGEVLAIAVEEALGDIDDVWRIVTEDHPIPYSPPLEDAFFADAHAIATSVRARLDGDAIPAAAGSVPDSEPTGSATEDRARGS